MSSHLEPRIRQLATEAREVRESTVVGGAGDDADDAGDDAGDAGDDAGDAGDADDAGDAADALDLTPLAAARDGLGPVLAVYVEARAGDEPVRFDEAELDLLHRATNDWLVVYARQRGVDADPDATVREAAELLVDTHDVVDVAAQLVGLPTE